MKLRQIFVAAGLAIAAMGVGTTADASPRHDARWEGQRDGHRPNRGWDRRDHRGWNRGGWHQARHCWIEWRHHRRVRVCR